MSSKKLFLITLIVVSFSMFLVSTAFGVEAYMKLTIDGNEISGDCAELQPGSDGTICVQSLGYGLILPTDAGSGLPTGQRQHRPLKVVKLVDAATPFIFSALTQNRTCDVVIQFFKRDPAGSGAEIHFFTITLQNAKITSINASVIPGPQITPFVETITFTYQNIILKDEITGAETNDSWETGRV